MTHPAVRSPAGLLAAFHEQVRLTGVEDAPGHVVERDGPVRRSYPPDAAEAGATIVSPEGLGSRPQHWIDRQVAFFTKRGQQVEWKTYGYDEPADLAERLEAAGFVAEPSEALVLGQCARLTDPVPLPDGVLVRQGREDDWDAVGELDEAVFGAGASRWSAMLRAEQAADPEHVFSVVATHGATGQVLAHSVLRLSAGTRFAGLWSGKVHPDWRRQGLYRAMVAQRARIALERGYELVRVDALPTSEPILTGLGLHAVTDTTPYVLPLTTHQSH